MATIVHLVHADPRVLDSYRGALAARGVDADVVLVNRQAPGGAPTLSSTYRAFAEELRRAGRGRILPELERRFPGPRAGGYTRRVLVSFSAGYGVVAPLLAIPEDVAQLDGYVALDSFHTRLDADHTASDEQLAGLVAFGLAAKEGRKVLWYGHSDVATPQTGPGAYASTTQVAAELARLTGLPRDRFEVKQEGALRIEAFDAAKDQRQEHGQALTGWGPGFVARALASLVSAEPPRPSPADGELLELGPLALQLALAEMGRGRGEIPPGSNGGKWVELYFRGCERGGKPLPLTVGEWCAAGACYTGFEAAKGLGARVPHRYRAAVLELWSDALSAEFGSAVGIDRVRSGGYAPAPGDLLVKVRGAAAAGPPTAPFVPTGGKGHVARIERALPSAAACIAANHGVAWGREEYAWSDPSLVGVISYGTKRQPAGTPELAALHRLVSFEPGQPFLTGIDAFAAAFPSSVG